MITIVTFSSLAKNEWMIEREQEKIGEWDREKTVIMGKSKRWRGDVTSRSLHRTCTHDDDDNNNDVQGSPSPDRRPFLSLDSHWLREFGSSSQFAAYRSASTLSSRLRDISPSSAVFVLCAGTILCNRVTVEQFDSLKTAILFYNRLLKFLLLLIGFFFSFFSFYIHTCSSLHCFFQK